jgi:hypothetical protein
MRKKQINEQFRRMQKLAGLITENQVNELLPPLNAPGFSSGDPSEIPLTPKVKNYIDKAVKGAISRGDMEQLQRVGYWEGDFPDDILMEFGDDFPEAYRLSDEVEGYIQDTVY